jgi:signal transduction histidine kinase
MVDPYLGAGGTAALMAVASPALLLGFDRLVEPVVYASTSRPAMKRLGDQLQASLGPDDVIGAVEKVLRDSLGVPNVAVELGPSVAGDRLGAVSEQQPVADRFPVTYQGRHVATLVVAPRPAEPALTGRDHLIVATLAQQAGPALHGARVVHELRSARERLVSAREEERRRIRRDLHDDLGPSLAGLRLTASALGSHLRADIGHLDAAAARQLADELARGIGDASGLVRRVVYDLQTAGVDGRGLLATLQHRLTRKPCDSNLRVVLKTDLDDGDELPAAVEVAATRIVTEAVTNARRHAHAGVCTVEIHHTTERLTIEIRDDGHGLDPDTPLGVGLRSIEERADELGGSSELRSSPAGTNVRVTLPLRPVTTAEPS